ncbi:MAG: two-component regulator propeller domain-containing protein, partial [Verrucomicrobiota bacterium]
LLEDRDGNLWVGTQGGLSRVSDGNLLTEMNAEGKPYDIVNSICQDREGHIWVGSRDALIQLKTRRFLVFTPSEGLGYNKITSVLQGKDGWVRTGSWGDGINLLLPKKVPWLNQEISLRDEQNRTSDLMGNNLVLAMRETRDGSFWFGLDSGGGLYQFKNGKLKRFSEQEGFTNEARVICEDRKGNLWIGTRAGLVLFSGGKFSRYTIEDGLADNWLRDLLEDHEGNIWIATRKGLSRRVDGKFKNFSGQDGLSSENIFALYEDAENSLWIGTADGGLNRYRNGKFTVYTTAQGLFQDEIFSIVEDDFGDLWMTSRVGISQVQKKDLDKLDRGEIKKVTSHSYGKHDGLATVECSGIAKPGAWKGRDGKLWFAMSKGVAVTDQTLSLINTAAPPIFIERILADKKPAIIPEAGFHRLKKNDSAPKFPGFDDETKTLILAPGHGELEFHYTALSYSDPQKNKFKYKLEGFDPAWIEAGRRREASYSKVPPGHYTFKVIGSNDDGVWNETGASLALVLLPHFWQADWFRGMMILLAGGTVGGIVRYLTRKKFQRKLEMLSEENAVERERRRIAKDIHDDLGASLTQIMLLSELTQREAGQPEQITAHAAIISRTATAAVRSMDEIVWAINPHNDNLPRLTGYICQFAENFFVRMPVRCRFDIPERFPDYPVSAEVRHNLFLAVKEVLNNVVKHSAATEVWLRMALVDSELRVSIDDNGKGFSLEGIRQFGNGLGNIKKPAKFFWILSN